MIIVDKIRELIAEGNTEDSINQLLIYVKENKSHLIDRIILLKSQLNEVTQDEVSGTISDQDASIKRAKINESILIMLNEVKPTFLLEKITNYKNQPIFNYKKVFIYFTLFCIILLVVLFFFNKNDTSIAEESAKTELQISTNEENISSLDHKSRIHELIGEFHGTLDEKKIKVIFEEVNNDSLVGYNIVENNKRPIKGGYIESKDDKFHIILNEPGNHKWDGQFKLSIFNENGNWIGQGTWKSYNKRLSREVKIKKIE